MTTLDDRVRFAERHITTPDGQPFTVVGREWVRDNYFAALDGWKLWPIEAEKLCDACAERAGSIVESYTESDMTRTKTHANKGCAGLRSEPILITAMHLKRQTGKSFNTAAWLLSKVFKEKNESICMLAGSEDQIGRIFNKNYRRPVENSAALSKRCRILGARLIVDKQNSDIELLPTSLSSVGDTRTVVVIDEARDVPAAIAVALLPTLFARGGWQCPVGHVKTHRGVDDSAAPTRCSVCTKKLEPWFGRALIMSSAGELTDSEDDWFAELIETYTSTPHPNVHVFATIENLNPKISRKMVNTVADVFGRMETTRLLTDIEVGGEFRRKGDDVVSSADIDRCTDKRLVNLDSCDRPCVGFLDTSTKIDKTALVIVADAEWSSFPWEFVLQIRLDYWDPAKAGGVIDPDLIEHHLVVLLSGFKHLCRLPVDTRGMPWADAMVRSIKNKHPSLARIVQPWNKHNDESERGWAALQQRILTRPNPTIRLQDDKEQRREFKGVRFSFTRTSDRRPRVVDRDRRKSHKDITESLATCCFLVSEQQLKGTAPSMADMHHRHKSFAQRLAQSRRPLARGLGEENF